MHSTSTYVSGTIAAGTRTRSVCCAGTDVTDMQTVSGDVVRQSNSYIRALHLLMLMRDRLTADAIIIITVVAVAMVVAVTSQIKTVVADVLSGTSYENSATDT